MQRHPKTIMWFIAVLLFALALAACGGGGEATIEPTAAAQLPAATATTAELLPPPAVEPEILPTPTLAPAEGEVAAAPSKGPGRPASSATASRSTATPPWATRPTP